LESGLNLVDLWIGGLAEATEPFGGMLGSTFNFVFEEQMEDLQDGDRFYYLGRTAGLNFLTQLEQNSFAGMISRNTDIGETGWHLPGDIFARVNYILEVDQSVQFNEGLGSADPSDGGSLFGIEMVIRDNPQTTAIDTNFLQFTGGDHVVIGGTNPGNPINVTGADHLIGGIGDDTIYGDGGDDTIEGGDGSDILLGGSGDDIITDIGGEDNIQGQDGNDYIFSGAGEDLILAGAGKDFVLGGPDLHETFGGLGDDFIHMGSESIIAFGGEGNDWMEGGGGNNLMQGDNGDPFLNSTVGGHDVFISGQGDDDYDSEGGDDIMEGADGVQRFEGLNGFDWATYKDVDLGVNVDMLLRAFDETPIPPSNASIFDRFDTVEGLSGGRGSDILRGDDEDRLTMETLNNGNNSVLSGDDRFEQIHGLREDDNGGVFDADGPYSARYNPIFNTVAGERTTEWGEGDIILGGAGSDLIEGRGGDDIIDGDLKLDVRLVVRNSDGDAIATAFKMEGQLYAVNTDGVPIDLGGTPLASNARDGLTPVVLGGFSNLDDAVANRVVNPGDIHIFREIIDESGGVGFDTAEFSDARDNYTISGPDADGFITVSHDDPVLGAGQGADGVDRVRNVERLQFADQTVELVVGGNTLAAAGATIVVDATGVEAGPADIFVGQTLRADPSSIVDADGTDNSIFIHFWQFEEEPGSGVFIDFEIFNGSGEAGPLEGAVIDVPPEAEGFALRVKTIFQDDDGVFETVFSDPTEPAAPEVSTVPTDGDDIILGTVDDDIIDALAGDDVINSLAGNDEITGGPGSDIIDGGADIDTAVFSGDVADFLFAPPEEAEFDLEIVDTLTDDEDLVVNVEFLQFDTNTSGLFGGATTIAVSDILDGETIIGGAGSQTLIGTDFDDVIDAGGGADIVSGEGGDDSIFGRGGADELEGGPGNDIVRGNGGNDVIGWRPGDGRDFINGGGNGALGDTVDIRTNGEGDTLRVWAVVDTDDRDAFLGSFPGVTLRGATEIVITYDPADGTGEAVIAEIRNVEELVINAEPAAAGVDADGTDISIIGNFDGTSLNQNTITINGSFNDETVDISQLTSDHRIVFNPGGGNDMIIGDLRDQDVINAQGGTTVTDNGDGTTTIDGPDIYRPAAFNLSATDLTELKKLVNGEESDLAEEFATGVRTLSGHGN
ncbi:MAG: peroxidase family protein, partial [Hyphomicrobiaceae bacterium]